MIQNPAMSSLVSAKGPSTMARLPPENFRRVPLELGCSPARSRSTPAFSSSSLYLAILLSSSSLGMTPASESLLAFTIIMNFMLFLPLFLLQIRGCDCKVCHRGLLLLYTSNENAKNRQRQEQFRIIFGLRNKCCWIKALQRRTSPGVGNCSYPSP